jgi:tetratricopeptide (TPR) repeat protein
MKYFLLCTSVCIFFSMFGQTATDFNENGIKKAKVKDYYGSIRDFNKAIQLDSNYASAYNNRGNSKGYLGDHNSAIKDFNKAIQLDSNYVSAYNNRGISKFYLNDLKGACLDWIKAGELGYTSSYELIKEHCN